MAAPEPIALPNHTVGWFDCIFHSFVTLTSLGYGDMVPISVQCRSLPMFEAVSGIMYAGILVQVWSDCPRSGNEGK
jgi:hypothetical protein